MSLWALLGLLAALLAGLGFLLWSMADPVHRRAPVLEVFLMLAMTGLGVYHLSQGETTSGGLLAALGGWMLFRRLFHRHDHGDHPHHH